jgi:hypothetical protein
MDCYPLLRPGILVLKAGFDSIVSSSAARSNPSVPAFAQCLPFTQMSTTTPPQTRGDGAFAAKTWTNFDAGEFRPVADEA